MSFLALFRATKSLDMKSFYGRLLTDYALSEESRGGIRILHDYTLFRGNNFSLLRVGGVGCVWGGGGVSDMQERQCSFAVIVAGISQRGLVLLRQQEDRISRQIQPER